MMRVRVRRTKWLRLVEFCGEAQGMRCRRRARGGDHLQLMVVSSQSSNCPTVAETGHPRTRQRFSIDARYHGGLLTSEPPPNRCRARQAPWERRGTDAAGVGWCGGAGGGVGKGNAARLVGLADDMRINHQPQVQRQTKIPVGSLFHRMWDPKQGTRSGEMHGCVDHFGTSGFGGFAGAPAAAAAMVRAVAHSLQGYNRTFGGSFLRSSCGS